MVLLLAFGLLLGGYTLLDWGHYRWQSKQVSMWYLLTGIQSSGETATLKEKPLNQSITSGNAGGGRVYTK